jgi:hypothetical protein
LSNLWGPLQASPISKNGIFIGHLLPENDQNEPFFSSRYVVLSHMTPQPLLLGPANAILGVREPLEYSNIGYLMRHTKRPKVPAFGQESRFFRQKIGEGGGSIIEQEG